MFFFHSWENPFKKYYNHYFSLIRFIFNLEDDVRDRIKLLKKVKSTFKFKINMNLFLTFLNQFAENTFIYLYENSLKCLMSNFSKRINMLKSCF